MAAAYSTKGFYFDERHGRYRVQFQISIDGSRIRRSRLLPRDITESEAEAVTASMKAAAMREMAGIEPSHGWARTVAAAVENKASWFHEVYRRARGRARTKRRDFELTLDDFKDLLLRSGGKCEVTGIVFSDGVYGAARMRPLIPSLDRRNAVLGYCKENCRIVCAAINVAMFNWGEEMFKSLAIGYLVNQVIAPHATVFQLQMPTHRAHPQPAAIQ